MEVLHYKNLNIKPVKKQFEKVEAMLKAGDFKSADVKKMSNNGFYRAKLDDTNRLLFQIGKYNNTCYLLLLEVILNHDYAKSRFLNGAEIDENKLETIKQINEDKINELPYINTKRKQFYFLDKLLSFDDIQEEIVRINPPCIIIGSAGSGKTAITLEKLKELQGKVLYVTHSSFLAENSFNLYSSFGYTNENQEVDFFSYHEYLCSIEVPEHKEYSYKSFENWLQKYKQSYKIQDTNKVYEEFKGVLTGVNIDKKYLSQEDYLRLGIKQSIFSAIERPKIYELFLKYIDWLNENNYFDSNIYSFEIRDKIKPYYDFVIIDEVQDLTNNQIFTIIASLKNKQNFILCGDSNQIVHPNFFSWSQVKTLFYNQDLKGEIIKILATNYRNTSEVTQIANKLLMIKNARFGSIDKESTYLVQSNSKHQGVVEFLENNTKNNTDINSKTNQSANFAVLVLRNEDKAEAKKYFNTPLLFSIQEAKGLEYENIILFDFISGNEKVFRNLCEGVNKEELTEENFKFNRSKDKSDKSIDEYKFYINSFYVGITRAVKNLFIIEKNKKHELLQLLDLTDFKQSTSLQKQQSSKEEWMLEASKLAKQGKKEQADAIASQILKLQTLPYTPFTNKDLIDIIPQAFNKEIFNKKSKDKVFEFALYNYDFFIMNSLFDHKYALANKWTTDGKAMLKRWNSEYNIDATNQLEAKVNKYGINFRNEQNYTPFMLACVFGAEKIAEYLINNGADIKATENTYRNALQLAIMSSNYNTNKESKILETACKYMKNSSIVLKTAGHLHKISIHQGEFWLLQYFIANSRNKHSMFMSKYDSIVFTAIDIEDFVSKLPSNAVPTHRLKRSYINSIFSKNEIESNSLYNKKLFMRLKNGQYILNPSLELFIENDWVSMRTFLGLDIYDMIHKNEILAKLYP